MAQFLAPLINDQQEDANGNPLVGGTIEVYLAGSSTHATTYSDKAGSVQNTWPITLNTLGVNSQGAVWLTGGATYKFIIKDSSGVTQRTIDNISGINDTAITADQWVVYLGTPTYVSATSFTVPGDQTQTFAVGTRVKTVNIGGIVYGTVVKATFSTSTTVVIIPDGASLDSGLSLVSTSLINVTNPSLPGTLTTPPFRNRIINGGFRIDQRNSGASQTLTAAAAIAYTVDRMYASCTGANVTVQQGAGTGYKNAVTFTGAASNTATLFGQRIESSNCFDWVGKQVNVQIPISSTNIATVTWNAYTADVADVFSAKTLIATGTLAVTSTVDTKYFSFNAGANAGRGIAIEFVTGALTAAQTIKYQGAFQAEAVQVSPFEIVEIGDDLRRCLRYFYKLAAISSAPVGAGVYYGATTALVYHQFPMEMRIAPTATLGSTGTWLSLTGGGSANLGSASALNATPVGMEINFAAAATATSGFALVARFGTAGNYIQADSEL